jgi:glycosyltransferase involved in cell wall biosynthesis
MPFLFDPAVPAARHIDLDEAESASRRRLADRYRTLGQHTPARFLGLEADLTTRVEREVLARFDRVYTCSAAERDALPATTGRHAVRVLPNVLEPADTPERDPPRGPFTFLFVGTLAFFPNADAVRFLCEDVVPRLRRIAPAPFRIVVVGGGASQATADVARLPEVRLTGGVADLDPWYERASAVIVPLRSGGGARIKVLEAMRARRPIVSTTEGIRGIDLRPGTDVLIGDTADDLASGCARLMREPALACTLRRGASTLFALRHTPHAMREALDG